MVVGTGSYKDRSEAYPLDVKTLNAVALRSLFAGMSRNAESADSVGWAWALLPALKKIHTDEEDLALCLGHHLEYVQSSSMLSTLTMGAVLALEQQKADLETIRSVRTGVSAAADSLGSALLKYLLVPCIATIACTVAYTGSALGAVILILAALAVNVILRFVLIRKGYSKGVHAAETLTKNAEALSRAARIGGLFMLGAVCVVAGKDLILSPAIASDNSVLTLNDWMKQVLPGAVMLLGVMLAYHLMVKKNRSVTFVVILFIIIAAVGSLLGIWGDYSSVLDLPWIMKG